MSIYSSDIQISNPKNTYIRTLWNDPSTSANIMWLCDCGGWVLLHLISYARVLESWCRVILSDHEICLRKCSKKNKDTVHTTTI